MQITRTATVVCSCWRKAANSKDCCRITWCSWTG